MVASLGGLECDDVSPTGFMGAGIAMGKLVAAVASISIPKLPGIALPSTMPRDTMRRGRRRLPLRLQYPGACELRVPSHRPLWEVLQKVSPSMRRTYEHQEPGPNVGPPLQARSRDRDEIIIFTRILLS